MSLDHLNISHIFVWTLSAQNQGARLFPVKRERGKVKKIKWQLLASCHKKFKHGEVAAWSLGKLGTTPSSNIVITWSLYIKYSNKFFFFFLFLWWVSTWSWPSASIKVQALWQQQWIFKNNLKLNKLIVKMTYFCLHI